MPNVSSSFCTQIQIANVKMWNETCKKLRISKDSKKGTQKEKGAIREKKDISLLLSPLYLWLASLWKKKVKSAKKRNLHHTAFPVRYVDIRRQQCLLLVLRITYILSRSKFKAAANSQFVPRYYKRGRVTQFNPILHFQWTSNCFWQYGFINGCHKAGILLLL